MDAFYKSNKDYALARIEASKKISRKNKEIVRAFVQRLLAEGISPWRIKKYLFYIRQIP
jgi:hypothetical protein